MADTKKTEAMQAATTELFITLDGELPDVEVDDIVAVTGLGIVRSKATYRDWDWEKEGYVGETKTSVCVELTAGANVKKPEAMSADGDEDNN